MFSKITCNGKRFFQSLNGRSDTAPPTDKKESCMSQLIFIPSVKAQSFCAEVWKDIAGQWQQEVGQEVSLQTNCSEHSGVIK